MKNPQVFDRVKVVNSNDIRLEGYTATIMGFYRDDETPIILFDILPQGYTPAIVMTLHCLERI